MLGESPKGVDGMTAQEMWSLFDTASWRKSFMDSSSHSNSIFFFGLTGIFLNSDNLNTAAIRKVLFAYMVETGYTHHGWGCAIGSEKMKNTDVAGLGWILLLICSVKGRESILHLLEEAKFVIDSISSQSRLLVRIKSTDAG